MHVEAREGEPFDQLLRRFKTGIDKAGPPIQFIGKGQGGKVDNDRVEKAEAAVGPVHDIRGIVNDPQYAALGTIVSVDDDELGGPVEMQNVLFRLSESPGEIKWAGRPHGANTDEVLAEIGVTPDQLAALRAAGVV